MFLMRVNRFFYTFICDGVILLYPGRPVSSCIVVLLCCRVVRLVSFLNGKLYCIVAVCHRVVLLVWLDLDFKRFGVFFTVKLSVFMAVKIFICLF